MHDLGETRTSRREFVRVGVAAALALPAAPVLLSGLLSGCGSGEPAPERTAPKPAAPAAPKPLAAPTQPAAPAAAPPPASAGGGGELVTEISAMAPLVTSLQYVSKSQKPDQNCTNCQFYTAGQGGRGSCQLFTLGLVEQAGWCSSWTKKVATG